MGKMWCLLWKCRETGQKRKFRTFKDKKVFEKVEYISHNLNPLKYVCPYYNLPDGNVNIYFSCGARIPNRGKICPMYILEKMG